MKSVEFIVVHAHDDGYFIFRFTSIADYEDVLLGAPYYFHNKSFVVQ